MKLASISVATAVGLSCWWIPACNSADPSAISEGQKALAEAMAKNIRLNEEIAELKASLDKAKADLEEAQAKSVQAEPPKLPSTAEVEAKLDQEIAKLKDEARQKYPGAKVESLGTGAWDLTSPSDSPFTCKAKVVVKEANGTRQTLYWTGSANLKGEWQFKTAENLEPQPAEPPAVAKGAGDARKGDQAGDFEPPTLTPAKDGEPTNRTARDGPRQPARPQPPAAPEKPKPKYDINFDNPVMGPGSR